MYIAVQKIGICEMFLKLLLCTPRLHLFLFTWLKTVKLWPIITIYKKTLQRRCAKSIFSSNSWLVDVSRLYFSMSLPVITLSYLNKRQNAKNKSKKSKLIIIYLFLWFLSQVFSVTWSFRNHSSFQYNDIGIFKKCIINIKMSCFLANRMNGFFVETEMHFFRILSKKKVQKNSVYLNWKNFVASWWSSLSLLINLMHPCWIKVYYYFSKNSLYWPHLI